MFKYNLKNIYRKGGKVPITIKNAPSREVQDFCKNNWVNEYTHKERASWIDRIAKYLLSLKKYKWDIKVEYVRFVLVRSSKRKFPGKNKVPNFWLNAIPETRALLKNLYYNALQIPNTILSWLVGGKTFLLPPNEETQKLSTYNLFNNNVQDTNICLD